MAPHPPTSASASPSAPTARPTTPGEVAPRVRLVRTVLAVLTAAIGVLGAARLLTAPGAGMGPVPPDPPGGSPASLLVAAALLVAVHAGLAVGVARYSEAARLVGAFVVGGLTLTTLLTTVRMFAFPPAQWPLLVVLAGLLCAAAVGWFVCAFHRPFGDACKGISRARSGPRAP
ncbi:hypothetical protein E4A47_06870 [Micrococcus flavus]|uniref:Uncharacterized protein n=1 Tax=Micrococcus flavus TaxID=384602 RepID=A0A4Y8X1I5_9MICC|nr:hypothetical protein [Micrococcus flavus]MBB4883361.1 hypothetical protein [Micrococcus flavus]TFI02798.1 hypothetical protein E4A47_06870 [Micrococcus flavus]GGK44427.1 hypothetical protein GCM10007073_09400 [Micrococcus flavus]